MSYVKSHPSSIPCGADDAALELCKHPIPDRLIAPVENIYKMAGALKRFIPLFDRVLVQKAEAITKTSSGILIPEKSVAKVLVGKVVAVGEGARSENGATIPPVVAVGDEVMLPEFGGTKVTLEEKDYFLFRDSDLLAKFKSE